MKISLKPRIVSIIFLLFGLITISGCSNSPKNQNIQAVILQTEAVQPSPAVIIPTMTLLPEVISTATAVSIPSPTPTNTFTPMPDPAYPEAAAGSEDSRTINEINLKKFIPGLSELPDRAMYRICRGCEDIVMNQEIIWSWGKAKADQYIAETGRINGWSIQYVRGSLEVYAPERLTLAVQMYNTVAGASLTVKKYNSMQVSPDEGWGQEECRVDFGSDCLYIKKSRLDDSGQEIVTARLYFSYHNLVGVVTGTGWPEDVVPEILKDAADKMYQKMTAVPLTPTAALTPTH